MVRFNHVFGGEIVCDKCGAVIRRGIGLMSSRALKRWIEKRSYCGACVQERAERMRGRRDKVDDKHF